MTKKEVEEKIYSRFPEANFEITNWDGGACSPITIKCLDCGIERTYTRYYGAIAKNKVRFCSNCGETELQQEVKKAIAENGHLEFVKWVNEKDSNGKTIFNVEIRCKDCERTFIRTVFIFVKGRKADGKNPIRDCPYCGKWHHSKDNESFLSSLDLNEFEPLEEYNGAHNKIKIRHRKCGFIFSITPANLNHGQGCPRCNRYNSKGSKKIKEYLDNHNIIYEVEKKFDWAGRYRYDFYIPQDNLLIEFNGEQHYRPIEFFLRSRSFEEQQESDRFKEAAAKEHGYNFLVIRYDEVDSINTILDGSTTISQESRGKHLEKIDA